MHFAIVKGTVVATQKVGELSGIALKVLVPCNEKQEPCGGPFVAADPIGARVGDFVMWVAKREASMAIPGTGIKNNFPLDAAVTGIVDEVS